MSAVNRCRRWGKRLFNIEPHELSQCLFCFAIFFLVLCAYYILRPIRDSLAITGGVKNIQWLFSATFVGILLIVPVYGWACSRLRRITLVTGVYSLVAASLLLFYSVMAIDPDNIWIARTFYVWVSVFNLVLISVFWSLMSDLFSREQAHRVFGFIAAGGSLGALCGPLISALLVSNIGFQQLLLLSAFGFVLVVILLFWLLSMVHTNPHVNEHEQPLAGNPFSGFTLVIKSPYLVMYAAFIVLISALSTFIYFQQAELVSLALPDTDSRTELFAWVDFSVNVLSVCSQIMVTGHCVSRFGVATVLTVLPLVFMAGFAVLALNPVLAAIIALSIVRRIGEYAFIRPCREMLFTSVNREVRYKAKNFIDTVVYRGGDAFSGWLYTACTSLGLLFSGTAWVGVGLAMICAVTGYQLGSKQQFSASDT
ncbi:MAG: MFS transporter [Gammaproteobacteria bacterium]|nr:MFS transporter [Gammaproteobacteria bacterium]